MNFPDPVTAGMIVLRSPTEVRIDEASILRIGLVGDMVTGGNFTEAGTYSTLIEGIDGRITVRQTPICLAPLLR